MDCRNLGYRDVSALPSLALDTRFQAGMTAFVYKGMALAVLRRMGLMPEDGRVLQPRPKCFSLAKFRYLAQVSQKR